MAVALDSSAVIGFLDRSDAFHEAADTAIRGVLTGGQNLCASVVTYAEVLTGAKLGHHDEDTVRGFFNDLVSNVLSVDFEAAERAAALRAEQRSLKMPDALIFAGADLHPDIDLIVCADEVAEKIGHLLDCKVKPLVPRSGS